jgi:hypothetical protein
MREYDPEVMAGYWRFMFYLAGGLLAVALVSGQWCALAAVFAACAAVLYVFARALAGR